MENRGIIFIVFGQEYDRIAAHTIAISRQFVDCEISIITNLKERNKKWDEVKNVNFIYVDLPDNKNREVKTQLYKYTPYDETIYCDCDCVFTKSGIEKLFNQFGDSNLILQLNKTGCWKDGKRYFKLYRDTIIELGLTLPLNIYQGAIFAFKKDNDTVSFFDLWHEYWSRMGGGRDMPSLACAVKNSAVNHSVITIQDNFFIFGENENAIIYHPVNHQRLSKYGIPSFKPDKSFDKNRRDDWSLVYFDEKTNNIINHPWIKKKFNKDERISRKKIYIETYLPEINKGGLNILDIATGPGEFLEMVRAKGNSVLGIDYCSGMIGREIDRLYEEYNLIIHKEKNLPVVYADFKSVIVDGNEQIEQSKYDIINCEWAINFIFREVFNHHPERGEYKNDGEWIFGERFDFLFNKYFAWCNKQSNESAIVMIAALHAINAIEYHKRIVEIAKSNGFELMKMTNNLNHKFKKCTNAK
jgi:hypothetical protein